MSSVVTRFAPSPTGHLHIGGARTALFAWAYARRHAGSFVLRIEDTDQARSSDESAKGIMEDLAWLGVEWDEGPVLARATPARSRAATKGGDIGGDPRAVAPFFQARRVPIYNAYIQHLVRLGRAYPAFETAEELEVKRKAAVAAKQTYRYDRAAYHAIPTPDARLAAMEDADASRTPYVVRFYMPDEDIIVDDLVLGRIHYKHGEGGVDDFVIRKADGFPTYHFAVVIDDELMGVTHVMRAQEHLNNTPRHVALQKALTRVDPSSYGGAASALSAAPGTPFRTPMYAHMPLICNMDGSKMSKRDKAKVARQTLKQRVDQLGFDAVCHLLDRFHPGDIKAFLEKENDSLEIAERIAGQFSVALPEIEVSDFREAGYVPEAIVNFLGLLGWNPGMKLPDGKDLEKFDIAFLAQHFSIDRIGATSAKFDRQKLLSFNGDYLNAMTSEQFADRWLHWLLHEARDADRLPVLVDVLRHPARRLWLADAVKARAKTLRDATTSASRFLHEPCGPADSHASDAYASLHADVTPGNTGLRILGAERDQLLELYRSDGAWTPDSIELVLKAFALSQGIVNKSGAPNVGPISQPLRVAVSGMTATPPLPLVLSVLGGEESLRRINNCLKWFDKPLAS